MLSQWLNTIKKTGLTPQTDEGNARKIMVVNSFSFITALLGLLYGVILSLLSGEWVIFYAILFFVAGFAGIIMLNARRLYTMAKFGLSFVFCCLLLFYGMLLGPAAQVTLLGLFLTGMPLLLFVRKERAMRCVCVFMPVVAMVLLEANYYYDVYVALPLATEVLLSFRWLIMAVILLLNYLIIHFHQSSLDSLVTELGVRNKALRESQEQLKQKEAQLKMANRQLESYSQRLEEEVTERTKEIIGSRSSLEKALEELQHTHTRLQVKDIELEKNLEALENTRQWLEQAKEAAENANNAKSHFLREISHEIRNPLNAIIGMSHLMLHSENMNGKTPRNIVNLVRHIHISSHSLLGIITNVLELAKIEAGKNDVVILEPFVLREWVRNTASVYETAAAMKEIEIRIQLDSHLPSQVKADRVHLTQILNNLLTNAIKFTPAKKAVLVQCKRETKDSWSLVVKDEGMGIAPEKLQLIFQPFEQADKQVYHHFGGSGLGLSIARRLAQLLGGDITVSSQPGIGTAFKVVLPLVEEKRPPENKYDRAQVDHLPEGSRILVMEDDKINQVLLKGYFSSMGLTATVTGDGEQGLAIARIQIPHLIILDMHMPVMSGREVLQVLRNNDALHNIPVIAISADAFSEQKAEVLAAGASEYLVKPLEFGRFYEAVKKYLRVYMGESKPVQ